MAGRSADGAVHEFKPSCESVAPEKRTPIHLARKTSRDTTTITCHQTFTPSLTHTSQRIPNETTQQTPKRPSPYFDIWEGAERRGVDEDNDDEEERLPDCQGELCGIVSIKSYEIFAEEEEEEHTSTGAPSDATDSEDLDTGSADKWEV
jgi:hypothetical protein